MEFGNYLFVCRYDASIRNLIGWYFSAYLFSNGAIRSAVQLENQILKSLLWMFLVGPICTIIQRSSFLSFEGIYCLMISISYRRRSVSIFWSRMMIIFPLSAQPFQWSLIWIWLMADFRLDWLFRFVDFSWVLELFLQSDTSGVDLNFEL